MMSKVLAIDIWTGTKGSTVCTMQRADKPVDRNAMERERDRIWELLAGNRRIKTVKSLPATIFFWRSCDWRKGRPVILKDDGDVGGDGQI